MNNRYTKILLVVSKKNKKYFDYIYSSQFFLETLMKLLKLKKRKKYIPPMSHYWKLKSFLKQNETFSQIIVKKG